MTIGVFDSGVGGLTVLRAIHEACPSASTAYLGDTARVPYGTRSAETVVRYAINAARLLVAKEELRVLVVACNTASAVALGALSEALTVPVIGVVEPTARDAVSKTKNGKVGIIGTAGTIRSGAYQAAVTALDPDVHTVASPCGLFVPLAEEGWTDADDDVVRQVVGRYLNPMVAAEIDTLILGCTHYPLLADAIHSVAPQLQLADAAHSVAEAVAELVGGDPAVAPFRRYYVTDIPDGFVSVAERFLGGALTTPIEVDL